MCCIYSLRFDDAVLRFFTMMNQWSLVSSLKAAIENECQQEEEDKPDEATDEAKDEAKDEAELLEAKAEKVSCYFKRVASERMVGCFWEFPQLSGFSIRFLLSVVELHGRFLSQAGGRHELAEGEELIFENAGWRRRRRSRRRQLGWGDPDFLKGWKMNFHFGARSAFEK